MTKKQRQHEEKIKQAIMKGRDRGVCDGEGRSVRGSDGHLKAKPRVMSQARKI